jgi:type II secretory pathway pseudopilin PulG
MWPKHKLQNQAGYSMVELLVSLGMTIVISAASFALFGSSMKFANATYHITDAEQSLRNAHEVMNRDLTTAGDGLRGIGTITAPLTFVNTFLTRTPVTCGNDPNYPCIGIVTSDDSIPSGTAVPRWPPTRPVSRPSAPDGRGLPACTSPHRWRPRTAPPDASWSWTTPGSPQRSGA